MTAVDIRPQRRSPFPHNLDAEASVLGGVILRNELLADLADLEIDDFYHLPHRIVWEAIRNLRVHDRPVDVVTLENELERAGKLEAVGGVAFLGELALRVPTLENVLAYAADVELLARNRAAIMALGSAYERARNWPHEPAELVAEVLGELGRYAEEARARAPEKPRVWARAAELLAAIESRAGDPWVAMQLGGEQIARVRAGGTVVLIGGSGSGKSSLASCLLIEHAKHVGPAIAVSIELPAEELGARIVGIRCAASWEDALCARVPRAEMERALDLPRLYVLDRRRATLANLELLIDVVRAEYPGEPILVAIDYAQLLDSKEREARLRVADAFSRIDDCAREKRFVALALSQMSRVSAKRARDGEAIGAESADLGAETAAIERFATLTLSIGMKADRDDGTSAVELSVGKARMGKGDRVIPMTYDGLSGLWRVAGEAKTAQSVREERDTVREEKARSTAELAMLAACARAAQPVTRQHLLESIVGRKQTKVTALAALLARRDVIEVNQRQLRSKYFLLWTPDRASQAGVPQRQISDSQGAFS